MINHIKELASAERTSDGTLYASPCRVHSVWVMGGATNGTVVLKDGGASGTVKLTLDVPGITTSGTTFGGQFQIPGDGLWFTTDCYLDVTTAAGCTILYSPEKPM